MTRTPNVTTTASVKRILRAAGLPLVTQKQWGSTSGLLVTSRMGFPAVMIDRRRTDASVLRSALDAVRAAGVPADDDYMDSGFFSINHDDAAAL